MTWFDAFLLVMAGGLCALSVTSAGVAALAIWRDGEDRTVMQWLFNAAGGFAGVALMIGALALDRS